MSGSLVHAELFLVLLRLLGTFFADQQQAIA